MYALFEYNEEVSRVVKRPSKAREIQAIKNNKPFTNVSNSEEQ